MPSSPIPSILTPSLISRQREIAEVFLKNGWGYMRRLLTGKAEDEPELPPPAVLRNILTELGPVYVKLGQLLSTRPDLLSPSYIQALSDLQSTVPAVPAEQIQVFIRQNMLRSPEEVFAEIDYVAIAAGSIGQTHRAVLKNGQPVAVKVQRPGIIKQVDRDMALIKDIARLVSTTQFGQRYNITELAEEFKAALTAELDFTTEARYTDELRQDLVDSRWVDSEQLTVPKILWPLTNSKILVMEWLDGKPLLQATLTIDQSATPKTRLTTSISIALANSLKTSLKTSFSQKRTLIAPVHPKKREREQRLRVYCFAPFFHNILLLGSFMPTLILAICSI